MFLPPTQAEWAEYQEEGPSHRLLEVLPCWPWEPEKGGQETLGSLRLWGSSPLVTVPGSVCVHTCVAGPPRRCPTVLSPGKLI